MIKVIGVRFRKAGKVYYFDPAQMEIKMGDPCDRGDRRGIEFGEVVLGVREVDEKKVIQPLKSVIRMATKNDEELERKNKEKEHEAFQICQEKIRKHELQMKLIDAEYTFDNNKLLFYFTADGRIDFRELVKDLAGRSLRRGSSCARLASGMRRRFWVASVSVVVRSVVIHIYRSLFRFQLRWQKSRTCP